jgi:hypothetical protein
VFIGELVSSLEGAIVDRRIHRAKAASATRQQQHASFWQRLERERTGNGWESLQKFFEYLAALKVGVYYE